MGSEVRGQGSDFFRDLIIVTRVLIIPSISDSNDENFPLGTMFVSIIISIQYLLIKSLRDCAEMASLQFALMSSTTYTMQAGQ